jgi:hypothetical protein
VSTLWNVELVASLLCVCLSVCTEDLVSGTVTCVRVHVLAPDARDTSDLETSGQSLA